MQAIGGVSPLAQRTVAQRDALQRSLDRVAPGTYTVAIGLKHADPKIEATIDELADQGVERIVAVVMAPHYSAGSVGQYLERTRAAAQSSRHRRGRARELGHRAGVRRVPGRGCPSAAVVDAVEHQDAVHRPLTAGAGRGRRRSATPTSCTPPPTPSPRPPVSASGRSGRSPGRAPVGRPSRGSGPTSSP